MQSVALTSLLFLGTVLGPAAEVAEWWPQFRGPDGNGHSRSTRLPLTWSETNGVRWKTPVHGRAWSSPVVGEGRVWVTTATEDGRALFALALDAATGQVQRDLKLFEIENPQFAHKFNTYASPTPALEPGRVYVTFGSPGTACLDTATGQVRWERRDFECNHYRGAGSSPILWRDLLLMHFDGSDYQYVVALDKRTGRTVWQSPRSIDFQDLDARGLPEAEGDLRKAFATPHVVSLDGRDTLLSLGAKALYAYEPATGRELWRLEERTAHSGSTRPVFGHGTAYYPSGFARGTLLAVQPGRLGDVLDANAADAAPEATGASPAGNAPALRVLWKSRRNVPCKPSLLLVGDLLFFIDDGGIASCLEAATGREVWRERVGGNYSASPLYADGRIYCFSEEGKTTVLRAARDYQVLAEQTLDDGFMASPAVSGNDLILRTRTHLYRIGAAP